MIAFPRMEALASQVADIFTAASSIEHEAISAGEATLLSNPSSSSRIRRSEASRLPDMILLGSDGSRLKQTTVGNDYPLKIETPLPIACGVLGESLSHQHTVDISRLPVSGVPELSADQAIASGLQEALVRKTLDDLGGRNKTVFVSAPQFPSSSQSQTLADREIARSHAFTLFHAILDKDRDRTKFVILP